MTFQYDHNQITVTDVNGNTLYFTYDASGTPQTVTYNGTTYYYATNLQGDITAILDSTGTTVVSYIYDAWGSHTSGNNGTGTLDSTLGRHNPLRYRGYVYDTETEFYYVASRYYDPTICRFINADDPSLLGANGDFTSLNLFAYCGNNPVSRKDESGGFWEIVVGAAIGGAIAGAIIGAVSHLVSCGINGEDVTASGLFGAATTGAVTGALGAVGGAVGGTVAVVASVGVGVLSGVITATNTEGPISQKIADGLTTGVVAGVGTYFGTKIPVAKDTAFTTRFTSFSGGLFVGAQTEIANVAIQ
ncbi:MAG: RHS repeat-associated core domain-containing protein [Oscillospiraceae bacterium]|nr:RHS repeat-associated core domain-containing protein [Oscillospiraceae bacterium]